ncbi:MAG: exo-alpha-sialidase [Chloroflexi bacterium]|nr:exo-alpha-sialidase [Chloroflexota bacterium]
MDGMVNQTQTYLEIVDAWTVYDQAPAMFPGLAYTRDGTLLASFSTVPDGLPGGEIHVIRSQDQGRTWSAPLVVGRSLRPGGAACNSVGMATLRDGTVLLPFNDVQTQSGFIHRNARLYIARSTDGGQTWEQGPAVAQDILEPLTYGQIVERTDGALLCLVWGRYREAERWRSAVLFSQDGGRNWGDYTTIAYDTAARLRGAYAQPDISGFNHQGQFDASAISAPSFRPHSAVDGFNETSVLLLPHGKLLAILRQQGVAGTTELDFFRAISMDGGLTWTGYENTGYCGMSPCLHISPQGRLLLAYRRCAPEEYPATQPGLSIAWSQDQGRTWEDAITLKEPKGSRYTAEYQVGYPALVNTPDGDILVAYYSYDGNLPHRRYLAANLLREITAG